MTTYDLEDLDQAIAERSYYGKVKVLTPPGKNRILCAVICGLHVGDLLVEVLLAMKHKIGLNKILGTIHPYPTFAEAVKLTVGVWRKITFPSG